MAAEASAQKFVGGQAYKSSDLLATPSGLTGVAVEHVLLCGSGLCSRDQRALEADLHDDGAVGGPTDALLDALAARVRAEVEGHRQRVARDLEPAAVDQLREADADLADREDQLRKTRARIQSERSAQETILRARLGSRPNDILTLFARSSLVGHSATSRSPRRVTSRRRTSVLDALVFSWSY